MYQGLIFLLNAAPDSRILFNLDQDTLVHIVMQILAVLIICGILTKVLYKPVRTFMAARSARIAGQLEDAKQSVISANELKAEYESKVKDINNERVQLLDDARREANERREKLMEEVKTEASELKLRTARDIDAEKQRAKDEVFQAIVDLSTDMASKLLSQTIDKSAHDRLFDEVLKELEATVFKPIHA